ncbi:MAG: TIGR03118 family protein [Acidobacteriia bacterium]|nr:TIGR03118 family protein [Terriglobia bacterium]
MKQVVRLCVAFLGLYLAVGCAIAQTNAYQQVNLVSSVPNTARHTDPRLINPWGMAFFPGHPFFIADNGRGSVRTYDAQGNLRTPGGFALFPPAGGSGPSTPSGIMRNPFAQFGDFSLGGVASQFLVVTEDGTISGWASDGGNFPSFATLAVDNSASGAVYTGMTLPTPDCCREFMAVANFHSGLIEPYTVFFFPLAPPGSFTDPNLPAGYAPFNIQTIGNSVVVTYALQDSKKHDPVVGAGNGIVDIFDQEGNFVTRFASHGPLNAPWGVVKASAQFGAFSNAILIGNFGDGKINAFDSHTGRFLGQLRDAKGNVIVNPGLRSLVFGTGNTGNVLFFAAGVNQGRDGLFGAIAVSQ